MLDKIHELGILMQIENKQRNFWPNPRNDSPFGCRRRKGEKSDANNLMNNLNELYDFFSSPQADELGNIILRMN